MATRLERQSALEDELFEQLYLMTRRESAPWPAPVLEHRFDEGCCRHWRDSHKTRDRQRYSWCEGCRLAEICDEQGIELHAYGERQAPAHQYVAPRKWRFDFAWPALKFAVEVDGGTRSGGRHVRPIGYEKDMEKFNAATLQGWRVVHVTGPQVQDGTALNLIEKALASTEAAKS